MKQIQIYLKELIAQKRRVNKCTCSVLMEQEFHRALGDHRPTNDTSLVWYSPNCFPAVTLAILVFDKYKIVLF